MSQFIAPPLAIRAKRFGAWLCLPLLSVCPALRAASLPDEMKQQAERWIELEQRIAEERNAWKADKEILTTSRDVLLRERSALQARRDAGEIATGLFRSRLEKARADLDEQEQARVALNQALDALEPRVRNLAARLPGPLRDRIEPQLKLLGAGEGTDPAPSSQRTQAFTSILASIDQFNNTLTLTHEVRGEGGGEERVVKVLYWGLAVAYASDGVGGRAWLVTPEDGGWRWHEANGQAARIGELIEVYEKKRVPQLVTLPVHVKGGL